MTGMKYPCKGDVRLLKSTMEHLEKTMPEMLVVKTYNKYGAVLKVVEAEKKDSIAKAGAVEPVAAAPAAAPATASAPEASTAPASDGNSIANANLLFKAGSFEAALQMYKALLNTEISPDERYFAMLQMGNIYRELRDFNSAAQRYRDVVQQFPDSDWATEAERALEDAVWLQKHASELPRRMR